MRSFDCMHAGPPGTGKTTLCKALSHKLCIRLSDRFTSGQLVEINSHSLFSKWFSEVGTPVCLHWFCTVKHFCSRQLCIQENRLHQCSDQLISLAVGMQMSRAGFMPAPKEGVLDAGGRMLAHWAKSSPASDVPVQSAVNEYLTSAGEDKSAIDWRRIQRRNHSFCQLAPRKVDLSVCRTSPCHPIFGDCLPLKLYSETGTMYSKTMFTQEFGNSWDDENSWYFGNKNKNAQFVNI